MALEMRMTSRNRGFSLLELLAVITIMGIIAALVITRISHQALDAKKKCCSQYCSDLNSAIEIYRFEQGAAPTSLSELEGEYYPEIIPKCPVNQVQYTIDATVHRVLSHNH
jgi:prepilin-type N-terminal cleavage/methylation domain-containing protein